MCASRRQWHRHEKAMERKRKRGVNGNDVVSLASLKMRRKERVKLLRVEREGGGGRGGEVMW